MSGCWRPPQWVVWLVGWLVLSGWGVLATQLLRRMIWVAREQAPRWVGLAIRLPRHFESGSAPEQRSQVGRRKLAPGEPPSPFARLSTPAWHGSRARDFQKICWLLIGRVTWPYRVCPANPDKPPARARPRQPSDLWDGLYGIFQNPSKFREPVIVCLPVPNSGSRAILETSEPSPEIKITTFFKFRREVSVYRSSMQYGVRMWN